jgi:predicted small secreted protein
MKHRAFAILLVLLLCVTIVSCRSQSGSGSDESPAGEKQSETESVSPSSASEQPKEDSNETEEPSSANEPEPSADEQGEDDKPETTEADSVDTEIPPKSDLADAECSFKIGSLSLTLRESKIEEKTAELPFALISDTTEELGKESDTFAGSFLKTVKYEGLELTLFAPKDNPEHFWVMQMTASASGIFTYRGVQVGDTRDTMLDVYPEAETIPGTEIYQYAVSEFEELTFTITDDTISQIALTYYMP